MHKLVHRAFEIKLSHTHSLSLLLSTLQPNRLHKFSRHILDVLVLIQQFLDDRLAIVLLEGLPVLIPLEKMKHAGVTPVSRQRIVDRSRLVLREPCGLGIDCLESICFFGICVNL